MDQSSVLEQIGRERRRYPRLYRRFVIRYSAIEDLAGCTPCHVGELLDISAGGLRFQTDAEVGAGRQLLFEIELPGWRERNGDWRRTGKEEDRGVLRVIGVVVWVKNGRPEVRCEVGVRFTGQMR